MSYAVKEIYATLQGEGLQAGRAAVFLRFAGCNLWSGREADREEAVCQFCDTDFVGVDGPGGGRFAAADELANAVGEIWPGPAGNGAGQKYVICTGGEPMLQLDTALIDALHARGFEVGVETNGTIAAVAGLDWICVSPKIGSELVQKSGDELKLVYPQAGGDPEQFETLDFGAFLLQPMDGPYREANTRAAADYCLRRPKWRLSVQTHKWIGLK